MSADTILPPSSLKDPYRTEARAGVSQLVENWYVYGIIATSDQLLFDIDGIDGNDTEVFTVGQDGLALIVSRTERSNYRALDRQEAVRYLARHQRVIEAVLREGDVGTVLPVKFGTVLLNEQHLMHLLTQGAARFRQLLNWLDNRVQMEIVVLWDVQKALQEIAASPEIVQIKAHAVALSGAERQAAGEQLGKLVQGMLYRRRASLQAHIVPTLREVTQAIVLNALMDDQMVVNAALLVDVASRDQLEQRLEELDAVTSNDQSIPLYFRCIGPLPPHSFVTVEVDVPAFAVIDAARQRLGLEQTSSFGAIKQAYHRLAAQLHPDLHPDKPDIQAQMTELVRAYQIITAYAESQMEGKPCPATVDAPQGVCDFSPEAVVQTLLLTIHCEDTPTL